MHTGSTMRVLYFSPRVVWPLISGAHLRDYYLARHLAQRAAVTYVGLERSKSRDGKASLKLAEPRFGEEHVSIYCEPAYRPMNVLRGFAGPTPLNILNYTSAAVMSELERLAREGCFDAVQIEGIHLFSYAKRLRELYPQLLLICDWHNIESEILVRYAEKETNPLRRWYALRTVALSRPLEDELLRICDAHSVCSEREREIMQSRVPQARVEVVPNGVDAHFFAAQPAENIERTNVVFMGRMDYHANIDAAVFFARKIWPLVRSRRPELRFVVVGANPTEEVLALRSEPRVEVTGTVEDIRPYYHNALAAVVPLRVGGGTRLKVLEAMAAGTPVISTTIGAEGLAIQNGKDILLADSAESMADILCSLTAETPEWKSLVKNARELVQTHYDWSVVGEALVRLYEEQVESRSTCSAKS